jgi:hypothetical protein
MSKVAFKVYVLLKDVDPIDKILMQQKYNFPKKMIHEAYLELCTGYRLPTVEEGEKIGWETLARIALTKEKIKDCGS